MGFRVCLGFVGFRAHAFWSDGLGLYLVGLILAGAMVWGLGLILVGASKGNMRQGSPGFRKATHRRPQRTT